MSKRFSSIIVATVSSLLLNTASFAGLDCNSCHENDPIGSKGKAAAFHYTVSKPNSDETRWWNDFETSKERDITKYVEDLASKDAKAATWFLLTGGKYGFSSRQATDEEAALILSAMKKVAQFFGNSNDRTQGLQEWATAKASVEAGHLHLQMLYKEVNKLKEDNKILNFEVASLKTKQQETEKRLSATEKENVEIKVRLSATEKQLQDIYGQLRAENESRVAEIKKLYEDFNLKEKEKDKDKNKDLKSLLAQQNDFMKSMMEASENRIMKIIDDLRVSNDKKEQAAKDREDKLRKEAQEMEIRIRAEARGERAKILDHFNPLKK